MYQRTAVTEQEAFDDVCWDLNDEEGRPQFTSTPKHRATGGARTSAAEKIVYIDTTPNQTKAYCIFTVIGLALGMLLTIWFFHTTGPKGVLASGITPIRAEHAFANLSPENVKQAQSDCLSYQAPAILPDLSLFAEHGEATDSVTENALICNIYQDNNAHEVYGAEYIVSAISHPHIDEGKVCDAAERYFSDALRLLNNQKLAMRAEVWVKTAIHSMNKAGAVTQSTFGDITLTCYGTPWMRVLTITPK